MTTSQQDRSDQIAALYTTFAARLITLVAARIRAPRAIIEDACAMAWETLLTRTHVRLERDGVQGARLGLAVVVGVQGAAGTLALGVAQ